MAFQSRKDAVGVALNKLAVDEATTLATPPTMAQPLTVISKEAAAILGNQFHKLMRK
jgi:hypothetical protein